jgi:hypothetical protein
MQQYVDALYDFDEIKLEQIIEKKILHREWKHTCGFEGCDCETIRSIWKELCHGYVPIETARFFCQKLTENKKVRLLGKWFLSSGTGDGLTVDSNIDMLLSDLLSNAPESLTNYKDREHGMNLLRLVWCGHSRKTKSWAQSLIDIGVDPYHKDVDGKTPLDIMIVCAETQLVFSLYKKGYDLNRWRAYDDDRNLLMALLSNYRNERRYNSMIKFLVENGIDLNHRDKNGKNVYWYLDECKFPSNLRRMIFAR